MGAGAHAHGIEVTGMIERIVIGCPRIPNDALAYAVQP
jgi:hypothetical protein